MEITAPHYADKFSKIASQPEWKKIVGLPHDTPYHLETVEEHLSMVVAKLIEMGVTDETMLLAAALHDIGKAATKGSNGKPGSFINHEDVGAVIASNLLRRLEFPEDIVKRVAFLVGVHMYPHAYEAGKWSDRAVRKFVLKMGDELENVLILAKADILGRRAEGDLGGEGLDSLKALREHIDRVRSRDGGKYLMGNNLPSATAGCPSGVKRHQRLGAAQGEGDPQYPSGEKPDDGQSIPVPQPSSDEPADSDPQPLVYPQPAYQSIMPDPFFVKAYEDFKTAFEEAKPILESLKPGFASQINLSDPGSVVEVRNLLHKNVNMWSNWARNEYLEQGMPIPPDIQKQMGEEARAMSDLMSRMFHLYHMISSLDAKNAASRMQELKDSEAQQEAERLADAAAKEEAARLAEGGSGTAAASSRGAIVGLYGISNDVWKDLIYPSGTPNSRRLAAYAKLFNSVEVASTYHKMPTTTQVANWAASVPDGFVFNVRAHKDIYPYNHDAVRIANMMMRRIEALGDKLGVVVLTIPEGAPYQYGEAARFFDSLPQSRYAVQIESAAWHNKEVYDVMLERRMALVNDGYHGLGLVPSGWSYTRVAASQLRDTASRAELATFIRQAWEPRVHVVVDDNPNFGGSLLDFLRQFTEDAPSGPKTKPMQMTPAPLTPNFWDPVSGMGNSSAPVGKSNRTEFPGVQNYCEEVDGKTEDARWRMHEGEEPVPMTFLDDGGGIGQTKGKKDGDTEQGTNPSKDL